MCWCRVSELPAFPVLAAAGIGGLLYWLAIYPIDQVKSAIMTDSIHPEQRKYPSIVTAFQVRFSQEILMPNPHHGHPT